MYILILPGDNWYPMIIGSKPVQKLHEFYKCYLKFYPQFYANLRFCNDTVPSSIVIAQPSGIDK